MRTALFLAIPALVAAFPSDPVLEPALLMRNVTRSELAEMKFFMEHSASVYCNVKARWGDLVTCDREGVGSKCPSLEADGVQLLWNYPGEYSVAAYYISINPVRKQIVFASRGTRSVQKWLARINIFQTPYPDVEGALVDLEFSKVWTELVNDGAIRIILAALNDNPGYRIVATGHSFGGAIASMAAAGLRKLGHTVDLYTYGAPRIGNEAFNNFLTKDLGQNYRVTNFFDPVPHVPYLCWGYRSISPEYWLSEESTAPEYPVGDIKICEGSANIDCNANYGGFHNLSNHVAYFNIPGCIDEEKMIGDRRAIRDQFHKMEKPSTIPKEDWFYCRINV